MTGTEAFKRHRASSLRTARVSKQAPDCPPGFGSLARCHAQNRAPTCGPEPALTTSAQCGSPLLPADLRDHEKEGCSSSPFAMSGTGPRPSAKSPALRLTMPETEGRDRSSAAGQALFPFAGHASEWPVVLSPALPTTFADARERACSSRACSPAPRLRPSALAKRLVPALQAPSSCGRPADPSSVLAR